MSLQRHRASKRKRDYPICPHKITSASECTLVVQGATREQYRTISESRTGIRDWKML